MKKQTYTLACHKGDGGVVPPSEIENRFEQYMEKVASRLLKSGKKRIDKWCFRIRIEE